MVAQAPDPELLQRGRDSFAGYNTLAIAFSFPVSFFGQLNNNTLGATVAVLNPSVTDPRRQQIDRVANPGVNVAFLPLDLDDVQNRSSTEQNSTGRVPAAIVATLQALGTNQAGIDILTDWSSRTGISCASTPPFRTQGQAAVTTPAPVSPTAGVQRMM